VLLHPSNNQIGGGKNVKSNSIKIWKENKKENLYDLRRGKDFLSKLQIAQIINRRLVNLTTLKLKPERQNPINKRQLQFGRRYLQHIYLLNE